MKIFWWWQSDTHQPSGRYFVRDVLIDLSHQLNGFDAEEASRPAGDEDDGGDRSDNISVDHDTLNVAGSPPIAETILRKICDAAVFIADVTPIETNSAGKRLPNPNVMIELGYAMRVLSHERIILVMNQAEGASLRYLPFDLRHWRAPVSYSLNRDASEERRAEVKNELKASLLDRIVPSLAVAAKQQNEDRRRTQRAPVLSLQLDDDTRQQMNITQKIKSLEVLSLDQTKRIAPLLPLPYLPPFPGSSGLPQAVRSIPSLANFGIVRPKSEWSRQEIETYNGLIGSFYERYEKFLDNLRESIRLRQRTIKVSMVLCNTGTSPATKLSVEIRIPSCFSLLKACRIYPKHRNHLNLRRSTHEHLAYRVPEQGRLSFRG